MERQPSRQTRGSSSHFTCTGWWSGGQVVARVMDDVVTSRRRKARSMGVWAQ